MEERETKAKVNTWEKQNTKPLSNTTLRDRISPDKAQDTAGKQEHFQMENM